jgi:hypothetical protein
MTSRRQRARAQREADFWAARYAAARTGSARAAVAFDRLRAHVTRQPAPIREDVWAQVEADLDVLTERYTVPGRNEP